MIEIVRKILMNKYVVFGIILTALILYCYYLRNEVKSLKLEIVQYDLKGVPEENIDKLITELEKVAEEH